jgi:hypothetical protein
MDSQTLSKTLYYMNPLWQYSIATDAQGNGIIAKWVGADKQPAQAELDAAWAAIQAKTFQGQLVTSGDDVDVITVSRIYKLIRSDTTNERLQANAESRMLALAVAALAQIDLYIVGVLQAGGTVLPASIVALQTQMSAMLATFAQVQAIRQEGIDFKTKQGW